MKIFISFSTIFENLLAVYEVPNRKLPYVLILFEDGFSRAFQKLMTDFDIQRKNLHFLKAARFLDPRKRAGFSRNNFCYFTIP